MATLTGSSIASTYTQLLKLTSATLGADASAKYIEDGAGTDSALSISTTRVGIGTSSPATLLDVRASSDNSTETLAEFYELSGNTFGGTTIGLTGGHAYVDINSTGGASKVYLDSNGDSYLTGGNVGIGTASPDSGHLLTLKGSATGDDFILCQQSDGGQAFRLGLDSGDDGFFEIGSAGTSNVILLQADGDSHLNGGNVGIGTASPSSNFYTAATILDVAGNSNNAALILHTAGTDWSVGANGTTNKFQIADEDSNVRMLIDSSGNVGIGTASPANPLAVNRSGDGVIVDFESADAVEGTVSISGTTTSYNAFVGSHYTQLKDGQNDLPVGAVVSSTGEIITCNFVTEAIAAVESVEAVEAKDAVLDDDGNITEEAVEAVAAVEAVEAIEATTTNVPNKEYFTYINTTTTASDPTVYGTWMGKMSDDAKGHSFGDDDKPIYLVAQVGLFKIRVTDTNGDISRGDYLESSTRAMEGQKQTSNAKVNSTIGKAMIDVDWSAIDADSDLGYKWKLIPCTF